MPDDEGGFRIAKTWARKEQSTHPISYTENLQKQTLQRRWQAAAAAEPEKWWWWWWWGGGGRGRRRRSDDREERGRSYTRYKNPAQTDNAEKQHQQNPQTQCNDNHDDVDDDDNDSDNSDDDNLMTMMRMKVEHQHTIRPRSSLNRSRKPCKIEGPSHSPLRAWVPKKSTEDLTGGWTWYYQTYKPSGSHPVESC